ncbi:MAG TPA: hypothetical protein VFO72_10095 [Pyrinomonadaceae bacterium]|nr:hypothetical protein [Pyrinomonadaceae bacterium]
MGKSTQFDRDDDADVKKVVSKTAPLGYLPILYVGVSLLFIIVVLFLWWRS